MRNWLKGMGLLFGLCAVATGASCVGNSSVEEDGLDGGGGSAGTGSVPAGAGVGEPCAVQASCRPGLACEAGTCVFGRSQGEGSRCAASGECRDGLQCAPGPSGNTCQPSGGAGEGEGCTSDLSCASGLRCGLVGFGAQCVPEGTTDAGKSCTSSSECYAGLTCAADPRSGIKACTPALPGVPSFGIPGFAGVTCDPPGSGPVRAFFEVPGAAGGAAGDFFRLPFPNDVRLAGGKPDLDGFPTPGADLLGFDPVQRYVDALEAQGDAWGTYSTAVFRFSGELDVESFRQQGVVNWVDVTPGAPERGRGSGLYWYYSGGRSKYVCEHWFGVRRPAGQPLIPGHTYAVYFTTGGKARGGGAIQRSEHLIALLGQGAPSDPRLAAAHAAFAPFRSYLADENISADTILNATVITAGDVRAPMAALAAAVEAAPAPAASGWVKCGGGASSPCPDATGGRACGSGTDRYDEYHALVSLPIFQEGEAPYLQPPAGRLRTTAPVRTEQVCLSVTVPKAAPPAGGYPLVVFAHGTGGDFRSHVRDEVAGALAAATDGAGAPVPLAVLGIDQVQHGPRANGSTRSANELFFNFANPDAARGNPLQGAADQLALARLAASLVIPSSATGTGDVTFDADALLFFGHSQGATHGSLMLPYAGRFRGAVLSGNGASLMDALLTKTQPVNVSAAVPFVLGDWAASGGLNGGDMHPVLSLLQTWIDVADPLNFARAAAREPVGGGAPRHLFQTYGLGDTYSPPKTMQVYAIAAGLGQAPHHGSANPPDAIQETPESAGPVSGNVTSGGTTVTAAFRQYGPPTGRDGHFVVFDVSRANQDMVGFFVAVATGAMPSVGTP